MAKDKKQFFIKGKDIITDPDAPIVSDEFIDKREDGEYTGQTIEVQSETKLEQDTGTGNAIVLRTYEFRVHPDYLKPEAKLPHPQEIFQSHMKGIAGMLWSDGLTPETGIDPRIIFSRDKKTYLIMVWASPQIGQVLTEKPKTLSEIAKNETKSNRDEVHGVVPVSSTKEKKTKRATKTPK